MLRKRFLSIFLFLTCFFASSVFAFAWQGRVIGVADGDTIMVLHNGRGEKIRLYGIDCPEKRQAYGKKAKKFTSDMVYGKTVEIEPIVVDRYGRTVAIVRTAEAILNEELVKSGYAWVYTKYCHKAFCSKWKNLQEIARDLKAGLWADPCAIPPWQFRHSRKLRPSSRHPLPKKNESLQKLERPLASGYYHGNVKTKVFHRPGCRYYNCSNCTKSFDSRDDAIAAGYKPCKICNP